MAARQASAVWHQPLPPSLSAQTRGKSMISYALGSEEERTCNGNLTVGASEESTQSTRLTRVKEMTE
jgi:hypothetical protein